MNKIVIRNIEKKDGDEAFKVFKSGFASKLKAIGIENDELAYELGLIDIGYEEGYFVVERNNEILGVMLLRWKGQKKSKKKEPPIFKIIKNYGFFKLLQILIGGMIIETKPKGDEIYIDHLVVLDKCRGLGIGTALLNKAFEIAKNNTDINTIKLTVIDGNDGAHKLYRKLGFKDVKHDSGKLLKWAIGVDGITEMKAKIR